MGGYSKEYPNQMAQQVPIDVSQRIYDTSHVVQKMATNKWHQAVDYLGSLLGWNVIFFCIVLGVCVLAAFLFKKKIKALLGDGIGFLNDWINK